MSIVSFPSVSCSWFPYHASYPNDYSVIPMLGTEDLMWTCKFRNGTNTRFKSPFRTTAEGAADAYEDLKGQDIESGSLSTEEADGFDIPRPREVLN
jgi:adenylylsulfate reductase subunit B